MPFRSAGELGGQTETGCAASWRPFSASIGGGRCRRSPRYRSTAGSQGARSVTATRRSSCCFHDTFVTYLEPEIGRAAVRVLESAGYSVGLADGRGVLRTADALRRGGGRRTGGGRAQRAHPCTVCPAGGPDRRVRAELCLHGPGHLSRARRRRRREPCRRAPSWPSRSSLPPNRRPAGSLFGYRAGRSGSWSTDTATRRR